MIRSLPDQFKALGLYESRASGIWSEERETGRPRGFGFVEVDDNDLESMIQALDGKDMGGRGLRVNEAQDRPRGGGGDGGGFGGGGGGNRGW